MQYFGLAQLNVDIRAGSGMEVLDTCGLASCFKTEKPKLENPTTELTKSPSGLLSGDWSPTKEAQMDDAKRMIDACMVRCGNVRCPDGRRGSRRQPLDARRGAAASRRRAPRKYHAGRLSTRVEELSKPATVQVRCPAATARRLTPTRGTRRTNRGALRASAPSYQFDCMFSPISPSVPSAGTGRVCPPFYVDSTYRNYISIKSFDGSLIPDLASLDCVP